MADANRIPRHPRLGMVTASVLALLFVFGGLAVALLAQHDVLSSSPHVLQGSGIPATQLRDVPSFGAVDLAGSNNVTIRVGRKQSVAVHGDDNLLRYVTTRVVAGTLVIGDTRGFGTNTPMYVKITTPSLRMLELSGSGTVVASRVRAKQFTVALSGSGTVGASGSVAHLGVTLTGSGEAQLLDLLARDARAVINGSGQIAITVTRNLEAAVPGSGEILYRGNPGHVTRSVTGSGAITPSG